ncbi:MAG: 2,3,4,5-tetrahydropyridine-2,6-dicarboxylate N-succinyltransferase, partial [Candidatus Cloacimonetes bacterium]|nr:2,3,4,5-tetrahydropyridine-2,6-dicarboxylate N-succinyltransferase [Candidatus Cloacimonadota bacterium]
MMEQEIIDLYKNPPQKYTEEHKALFMAFSDALNRGIVRSCEKKNDTWIVNEWVKMGILTGFRMGELTAFPWSEKKPFFDKDTIPEKLFTLKDRIRIVPGGSSARNGCY